MTFSPEKNANGLEDQKINLETEVLSDSPDNEYVSEFTQNKKELKDLFNIEVTSEASLKYPWVIKEFYELAMDNLKSGDPFALEEFFNRNLLAEVDIRALLTKEEPQKRNEIKLSARTILKKYTENHKGLDLSKLSELSDPSRLARAKNIFIDTGILNQEEVNNL